MTYYSIHFNRPDFVEIQYDLSKKVGYELVIVNNGRNKGIKDMSKKIGVRYMETDNLGHNSFSHGNSINQILPSIDMNNDWGLLDYDMFMTSKINFIDSDIIGVKCDNVPSNPYLWPGMIICKGGVDLSHINFNPGISIPGDTGCGTYSVIKDYNIKWCKTSKIGDFNSKSVQDSKVIISHTLEDVVVGYHYLNGSNWTKKIDLDGKNSLLLETIKNFL